MTAVCWCVLRHAMLRWAVRRRRAKLARGACCQQHELQQVHAEHQRGGATETGGPASHGVKLIGASTQRQRPVPRCPSGARSVLRRDPNDAVAAADAELGHRHRILEHFDLFDVARIETDQPT